MQNNFKRLNTSPVIHQEDKPSFIIMPPFFKEYIDDGIIKLTDLLDVEGLSSILSIEDVKKFLYLNICNFNCGEATAYADVNKPVITLLNEVNKFYTEPTNECIKEDLEIMKVFRKSHNRILNSIYAMINSYNAEPEFKMFCAVGSATAQGFTTYKIKSNVYGILLNECAVCKGDELDNANPYYALPVIQQSLKSLIDELGKVYSKNFVYSMNCYKLYVDVVSALCAKCGTSYKEL